MRVLGEQTPIICIKELPVPVFDIMLSSTTFKERFRCGWFISVCFDVRRKPLNAIIYLTNEEVSMWYIHYTVSNCGTYTILSRTVVHTLYCLELWYIHYTVSNCDTYTILSRTVVHTLYCLEL